MKLLKRFVLIHHSENLQIILVLQKYGSKCPEHQRNWPHLLFVTWALFKMLVRLKGCWVTHNGIWHFSCSFDMQVSPRLHGLNLPDLGQDCELKFLQPVVRREALGPSRIIVCKYRLSYVMRLQMESWIGYECGSNARVWDISKETWRGMLLF